MIRIQTSAKGQYLRLKSFPNKEAQTEMKIPTESTTQKSKFLQTSKIWHSYVQQFVGGKQIGDRVLDENDLVKYQRNMKGRRIFIRNLSFDTHWQAVKDHMRKAGDVVRVDLF